MKTSKRLTVLTLSAATALSAGCGSSPLKMGRLGDQYEPYVQAEENGAETPDGQSIAKQRTGLFNGGLLKRRKADADAVAGVETASGIVQTAAAEATSDEPKRPGEAVRRSRRPEPPAVANTPSRGKNFAKIFSVAGAGRTATPEPADTPFDPSVDPFLSADDRPQAESFTTPQPHKRQSMVAAGTPATSTATSERPTMDSFEAQLAALEQKAAAGRDALEVATADPIMRPAASQTAAADALDDDLTAALDAIRKRQQQAAGVASTHSSPAAATSNPFADFASTPSSSATTASDTPKTDADWLSDASQQLAQRREKAAEAVAAALADSRLAKERGDFEEAAAKAREAFEAAHMEGLPMVFEGKEPARYLLEIDLAKAEAMRAMDATSRSVDARMAEFDAAFASHDVDANLDEWAPSAWTPVSADGSDSPFMTASMGQTASADSLAAPKLSAPVLPAPKLGGSTSMNYGSDYDLPQSSQSNFASAASDTGWDRDFTGNAATPEPPVERTAGLPPLDDSAFDAMEYDLFRNSEPVRTADAGGLPIATADPSAVPPPLMIGQPATIAAPESAPWWPLLLTMVVGLVAVFTFRGKPEIA